MLFTSFCRNAPKFVPFFVPNLGKFTLAQGHIYDDKIFEKNLKNLRKLLKLRKTLMFSVDAMGNFEELFNEIDTDQNGSISICEIMVFCKKKGLRLGFSKILTFVKYFDQVTRI